MQTENNLQVAVQPQMNMQEMQTMAKLFAESGMFPNVNSMAKAFIKIQAGIELGIAPFASMSGIHIIKEKATVGAGLMAGKVKASGKYDYKIIQLDNDACVLDFYEAGKTVGTEKFTIADAKKAGTQNLEKFAKNMLFARAISNGVKFYCPDLYTMPVYTPEEMQAVVTEDVTHEEVKAEPTKLPAIKKTQLEAACKRIAAGETELTEKLKLNYTFAATDIEAIVEAKRLGSRPVLNEMEFASAIDGVKAGTQQAADIIATFRLTTEQADTLAGVVPAA